MKKKTLSLILASAMAATLMTGCGSSSSSSESTTETSETETAAEEETSDAEEAEEEAEAELSEEAASWPNKTVTIVVPYAAGGDTDVNARALADKLSEVTGGTFVVSNTEGNGGATGAMDALSADPDGYTILFHHTGFVVNQLTGATTYTYDDTEFVGIVGRSAGNIITMNADYGITTIDELIAYTEEHPGELKITANTGATTHATALQLRAIGADVKMVDAGSASERISALLGGQVDIIVNPINTLADYFKTGELVGLCTDSDEESEVLASEYGMYPAANQGYPELGFPFYYTMMFPKGTDQGIVDKCASLLEDIIMNDEEYQTLIYDSYLQEPYFEAGEAGKATMESIKDNFTDLDFNS